MKETEKIGLWVKDEKFMAFASSRATEEFQKQENNRIDPMYEELSEGFDDNEEYVEPMVDYLSYRLHLAKICRNRQKRERGIWWVWTQLKYEGHYVETYLKYYAKLVNEVQTDIYIILHHEYVRQAKKQNTKKQ